MYIWKHLVLCKIFSGSAVAQITRLCRPCKWSSYTRSSNVHYKQGLKLTVCKLKHINWKLEAHIELVPDSTQEIWSGALVSQLLRSSVS